MYKSAVLKQKYLYGLHITYVIILFSFMLDKFNPIKKYYILLKDSSNDMDDIGLFDA